MSKIKKVYYFKRRPIEALLLKYKYTIYFITIYI